MALVKIKEKYQVTLPAALRQKAGLEVGDLLEAKVEGKKITLTPKSVLDRELAQALKEIEQGKTLDPCPPVNPLRLIGRLHAPARDRAVEIFLLL